MQYRMLTFVKSWKKKTVGGESIYGSGDKLTLFCLCIYYSLVWLRPGLFILSYEKIVQT